MENGNRWRVLSIETIFRNDNSRSQASSGGGAGGGGGDTDAPSDLMLSYILDEVIENMPYAERPAPDVNVLLNMENRQLRSEFAVRYSQLKKKPIKTQIL